MDHEDMKSRALPFVLAMLLIPVFAVQPVSALFSRGEETKAASVGAPIAQNLEVRAFRNVPYTGTLSAVDKEGGEMSYAVETQPTHGTLVLEGEQFTYTPEKNRIGTDRFTYTATDAEGNVSAPAEVKITVERCKAANTYADMELHPAYTAAVDLAERGVFRGTEVGGVRFFEPDRPVSRGEFVTMALCAVGLDAAEVSMTGFCDDAEIPTWAKGYAVSALSSGVIRGVDTENGLAFCADNDISLNEAATVLNRLLTVTDVDISDYYAGSAEAWSAQAVANLTSVSVLESGSFADADLKRPLTRAEAAQLLSAAVTLAEQRRGNEGLLTGLFK